ncbi:enoyl-CoA hydratase/isomerase [Pseudomonas sp. H3(2019)]|uniref:enoyl-CoA hydratase/isomerase n=1 Tax=Pseudomonas sp. H3(2019) TaxID=2598724 RepID=UPI0011910182|nr:enoyl-CoA hydratase/isomerase [Pseudomonas sp. H3(2019)]TVT86086.1 enoyl-CoA hydratase/isomerase [Pseudomonas sp. H3(2019)]
MSYQTIQVRRSEGIAHVTLANKDRDNAINETMLSELHAVLDAVQHDNDCRLIVLRGQEECFCTGMDIRELAAHYDPQTLSQGGKQFWDLMHRIVTLPKITIALVDGRVSAGGVGIVAACDLVLASKRSQFSLPEALWGLLPCCVLPFLGRRIGFQKAYSLMLTTQTIKSDEAHRLHLVDELSDEPERAVKKHLNRIGNLNAQTIKDMKQFAHRLWPISEASETVALQEYTRLLSSQTVVGNIKTFVEHGLFPWEKSN